MILSIPNANCSAGECKDFYLKFMICLAENGNLTSACRDESKAYLGCRYIKSKLVFDKYLGHACRGPT